MVNVSAASSGLISSPVISSGAQRSREIPAFTRNLRDNLACFSESKWLR